MLLKGEDCVSTEVKTELGTRLLRLGSVSLSRTGGCHFLLSAREKSTKVYDNTELELLRYSLSKQRKPESNEMLVQCCDFLDFKVSSAL